MSTLCINITNIVYIVHCIQKHVCFPNYNSKILSQIISFIICNSFSDRLLIVVKIIVYVDKIQDFCTTVQQDELQHSNLMFLFSFLISRCCYVQQHAAAVLFVFMRHCAILRFVIYGTKFIENFGRNELNKNGFLVQCNIIIFTSIVPIKLTTSFTHGSVYVSCPVLAYVQRVYYTFFPLSCSHTTVQDIEIIFLLSDSLRHAMR